MEHDSDSDGEGQSFTGSYTVSTDDNGMPAAVNILKPQIDLIFSEVQKNLPTIDFDSSDVSVCKLDSWSLALFVYDLNFSALFSLLGDLG